MIRWHWRAAHHDLGVLGILLFLGLFLGLIGLVGQDLNAQHRLATLADDLLPDLLRAAAQDGDQHRVLLLIVYLVSDFSCSQVKFNAKLSRIKSTECNSSNS